MFVTSFRVILVLAFSVSLYLIEYVVFPLDKKTEGTLSAHACGEGVPAGKCRGNTRRFFSSIAFFTVFDVSAFSLSPSISSRGVHPILFSVLALMGLITLHWRMKGRMDGEEAVFGGASPSPPGWRTLTMTR
jgi:hypothetical protein